MAIDVIEFPDEKRHAVMRRMGTILTEIASEAGCPREMAREFGATMEQTIRAYVPQRSRHAVAALPAQLSEVIYRRILSPRLVAMVVRIAFRWSVVRHAPARR